MVWSFARGLLIDILRVPKDLFWNRKGASKDMQRATDLFNSELKNIIMNATAIEREERWSVHKVLDELRSIWSRGNGKECVTRWNWHKRFA